MKVIFDNFSLREHIFTLDAVKEVIEEAKGQYPDGPRPQYSSRRYHKIDFQYHNSLYKATQGFQHDTIRHPRVYQKKPRYGPTTEQYAVVMPNPVSPRRWLTYVVDLGRNCFVNLGPKNGAIIGSSMQVSNRDHTGRPRYWKTVRDFTVRVNEGAKNASIEGVTIPALSRQWVNPTGTILMDMQIKEYCERADGSFTHGDIFVGVWGGDSVDEIKQRKRQWRKLEVWEKECPGLILDMTRPDFPLDEQDAVMAIMT